MSLKSAMKTEKDEIKELGFDDYIYMACKKFNIPGKVIVNKVFQNNNTRRFISKLSEGITVLGTRTFFTLPAASVKSRIVTTNGQMEDVLNITAVYDAQNKLVEILLSDATTVPCILMQILGLIIPRYPFLTRVAIKKCKINKYIIYEMNKFLEFTSVTDICLDGSTVCETNLALLLQNKRISNLSLSRCGINDSMCETIASQLHYLQPMQCYLTALNLSINCITDVGARYFGLVLRSNRCLQYLNLAGNCITDEGANYILKPLMSFSLTQEEIKAERILYADFLKNKFADTKTEENPKSKPKSKKSQDDLAILVLEGANSREKNATSKRKKKKKDKPSLGTLKDKVKRISSASRIKEKPCNTSDVDGTPVDTHDKDSRPEVPFEHPFSDSNVKEIGGVRCCTGNMVLCYLNLGYNNISYRTVKTLNNVLKYQNKTKGSSDYGLVKVIIEGNDMPSTIGCNELDFLNDHLKRNVLNMSAKHKTETKTKCNKNKSITFSIAKTDSVKSK